MFPRKLKARAIKLARERGVSFGELVRESVAAALAPAAGDSLLSDDSVFLGETPSDLSAEHDKHLYGDAR